ncbi:hypothetical protein [Variovorax paradoxus]|uniref:hypothetical protein n=1 Tax=Variovorax paradoxus TaxID=34073 RepID=UPI003D66021D
MRPVKRRKSHWHQLPPQQQTLNSGALVSTAAFLVAYGIGGVVHGHLATFPGSGFGTLHGATALSVAMASLSFALALLSHLNDRYSRIQRGSGTQKFRGICYRLAGALLAAAFVAWLLEVTGALPVLGRFAGLAPDAEWPLAPVSLLWQFGLSFVRDDVVARMMLAGVLLLALWLLFARVFRWGRGAVACLGLMVLLGGVFVFGFASYGYAGGHALQGIVLPDMYETRIANPGEFHALILFAGWSGLILAAFGTLGLSAAVITPQSAIDSAAGIK